MNQWNKKSKKELIREIEQLEADLTFTINESKVKSQRIEDLSYKVYSIKQEIYAERKLSEGYKDMAKVFSDRFYRELDNQGIYYEND